MRQVEFLKYALEVLARLDIPYAVVGSYASSAWGEPRMTRDIDIVVALDRSQIEPFCTEFPDVSFYVSRSAVQEAIEHQSQFNVIHPASGNKIDFMIATDGSASDDQLRRRQLIEFEPAVKGYVASPEDVILGKLVYYREGGSEKHLRDIKGILKVSRTSLDREYLERRAAELEVASFWQTILDDPK